MRQYFQDIDKEATFITTQLMSSWAAKQRRRRLGPPLEMETMVQEASAHRAVRTGAVRLDLEDYRKHVVFCWPSHDSSENEPTPAQMTSVFLEVV